ncbi:hypothetical protein [Bacteroides sp.]
MEFLAFFLPSLLGRGWGRGFIISNCFAFPASGLRDYPSGVFWGVGIRGYSWSSSSTGIGSRNSGNLNTGDTNVNPLNNNNRTYGFPVRCVQELTASLF